MICSVPTDLNFDWRPADPAPVKQDVKATPRFSEFWREDQQSFSTSVGFTTNPDSTLVGLEYSFFVKDRFSVGPLLQMGFDDDYYIVAPTINFKMFFDVNEPRLNPYLNAGIGMVYINVDHNPGDNDGMGLLLNLGAGVDYQLSENLSLGTNVLCNFIPNDVMSENFFFSWQFLSISFRF